MSHIKYLFISALLFFVSVQSAHSGPVYVAGPTQLEITASTGLELDVTGDLYLNNVGLFDDLDITIIASTATTTIHFTSPGFIPELWPHIVPTVQTLDDSMPIIVTGDVLVDIIGTVTSSIFNVTGNVYIGSYLDPLAEIFEAGSGGTSTGGSGYGSITIIGGNPPEIPVTGITIGTGGSITISPEILTLSVPEPSGLALMVLGLFSISNASRFRQETLI